MPLPEIVLITGVDVLIWDQFPDLVYLGLAEFVHLTLIQERHTFSLLFVLQEGIPVLKSQTLHKPCFPVW